MPRSPGRARTSGRLGRGALDCRAWIGPVTCLRHRSPGTRGRVDRTLIATSYASWTRYSPSVASSFWSRSSNSSTSFAMTASSEISTPSMPFFSSDRSEADCLSSTAGRVFSSSTMVRVRGREVGNSGGRDSRVYESMGTLQGINSLAKANQDNGGI